MSAVAQTLTRHWPFSVDDYQRMGDTGILHEDDRVELIDGEIVAMPPIGSPHGGRVNRLTRIMISGVGERAIVAPQNPIVLGRRSEPEPDLAILRPRPDFYTDSHPQPTDVLLLIEVAESSRDYDLNVKVPLYARHAIPEVWVVDIPTRQVLRFSRPHAGTYQDQHPLDLRQPVAVPGLAGCTVDLGALF
jgi:Uma2 family endonuclease